MNASAAALELLAQLADKVRRTGAANAVARAVGCDAFYVLVLDTTVERSCLRPVRADASERGVDNGARLLPDARRASDRGGSTAGTTRAATVRSTATPGWCSLATSSARHR